MGAVALGIGAVLFPEAVVRGSEPLDVRTPRPDLPHTQLELGGLTFVLGGSEHRDGVDTEEYVVAGESVDTSPQLLSCQRIHNPRRLSLRSYLEVLQRRTRDSAAFRLIRETENAAVFALHYPARDGLGEQIIVALISASKGAGTSDFSVVQFTGYPARMSFDELGIQVQRWQARFLSQLSTAAR